MHFAQRDDMSVMVPAVRAVTTDYSTRNILGVDPTVNRILNWERAEDREKLEQLSPILRLYNPRPFRAADILLHPEPAIVIDDDEPLPETAQPPPKRRRALTLSGLGRTSSAKDYDPRTHPGPAGGTAAALRMHALLRQTRMLLDLL